MSEQVTLEMDENPGKLMETRQKLQETTGIDESTIGNLKSHTNFFKDIWERIYPILCLPCICLCLTPCGFLGGQKPDGLPKLDESSLGTSVISSLYCIGGENDDQEPLSSVSVMNSVDQEWKNGPSMITGKTNFSGAVIRDKIYVCDDNLIEVMDTRTGEWSVLAETPDVREDSASAALNGFIYVAGGSDDRLNSLATVHRFDIQNGVWEPVAPMLEARCGHRLVELGGHLYAISGMMSKTAERYNPLTDEWTMVSSLRYQHVAFSATLHLNEILISSAAGIEVYSKMTNCWRTLPPIGDGYHGRTLASFNHRIWALGGGKNGSDGTAKVYIFSSENQNWERMPDMNVARMYHCSFVID